MTAIAPGAETAFRSQFDQLTALARENEATGGGTAWFNAQLPADSAIPNIATFHLTGAWRTSRARDVFSPEPGTPQPDWYAGRDVPIALQADRRAVTADPADDNQATLAETTIRDKEAWNTVWHARPLTVGRVCISLCGFAPTQELIAYMTGQYRDWRSARPDDEYNSATTFMLGQALARSVTLALTDTSRPYSEQAAPVLDFLAGIRPDDAIGNQIRSGIVERLGEAATITSRHYVTAGHHTRRIGIPPELARDALYGLDDRGAIDEQWLAGFGIFNGGVFAIPELLERVWVVATGENGGAVLAATGKASTNSVADYIARLVASYAQDPSRDDNARRLLGVLHGDMTRGRRANVEAIFATANATIRSDNRRASAQAVKAGRTFTPTPEFPAGLSHVGHALMFILNRLRNTTDQRVESQQLHRDVMHIDIIEGLHVATAADRTAAVERELRGWAHLEGATDQEVLRRLASHYPDARASELRDMLGRLRQGQPPVAVDGAYRGRQTGRIVNPYRIKKPGSGLIS